MPEEEKDFFSEVTFEHSLIGFTGVHRRLRRERMYQTKTHTNQHTHITSWNVRSFWSTEESSCLSLWHKYPENERGGGRRESCGWLVMDLTHHGKDLGFFPLDSHCPIQ